MEDILKGNFEVKKPVQVEPPENQDPNALKDSLRKRALASLGGSMVYVERDLVMWDGEGDNQKK